MTIRTRFAPSPTGPLHLGHAFSALTAWDHAQAARGTFLLRIEDIDIIRCTPQLVSDMLEDLAWLGLEWEEPVLRQSRFRFAEPIVDLLLAFFKNRFLLSMMLDCHCYD